VSVTCIKRTWISYTPTHVVRTIEHTRTRIQTRVTRSRSHKTLTQVVTHEVMTREISTPRMLAGGV
jgi:hypothetical protein